MEGYKVKFVRQVDLVNNGDYKRLADYRHAIADIEAAVEAVIYPPGSESFTLNPTRKGNGVRPIKDGFTEYLKERGWEMEYRPAARKEAAPTPGAFDCHLDFEDSGVRPFAVEWETGNISSSHRAINRLAVGILNDNISAGILVVPSQNMYPYLTDRIGNFRELQPYLELWGQFDRLLDLPYYLGVVVVEQDALSADVPTIAKGTDGRALI